MNEFTIGERVRFKPGAEVSDFAKTCEATVKGYEVDVKIGGFREDYLVVSVDGGARGKFEQWVNPREVEPMVRHTKRVFHEDRFSDSTTNGVRRKEPHFLDEEDIFA